MYRNEEQRTRARRLRNQATDAEKLLWRHLRAGQFDGHRFRRQAAFGPYIVDFVCFSHKLIIELDGPQHFGPEAVEYDARRTAWLTSEGFRVFRFRNQQLDDDIRSVLDTITTALESPLPNPPHQGEGTDPKNHN
jgi:very-short-patch-repair endonuclease